SGSGIAQEESGICGFLITLGGFDFDLLHRYSWCLVHKSRDECEGVGFRTNIYFPPLNSTTIYPELDRTFYCLDRQNKILFIPLPLQLVFFTSLFSINLLVALVWQSIGY
ncbi:hypothetical protein ACJX0J_029089, partial [Zea mays]